MPPVVIAVTFLAADPKVPFHFLQTVSTSVITKQATIDAMFNQAGSDPLVVRIVEVDLATGLVIKDWTVS